MNTDSEKDFELMLRRVVRAAEGTSPLCPKLLDVLGKANDLLKRKGTSSPLKSNPYALRENP